MSSVIKTRASLVAAVLTIAAAFSVIPGAFAPAQAAATLEQGCIASVPEPGTTDPVDICYTLYRPAGASAASPVPLIFHSHGWGGSRTNSANAFGSWVNNGFGVLSFDQRGFGQSGGLAHIENPDFEGEDVRGLVDLVGSLDWVVQDAPGDPRIGAIGGSYGGGYQFVGAFTDLMRRGETRFDALAPEITWWDLSESLAPAGVVRTAWVTTLFAAGATAVPPEVQRAFVEGAATGEWPDGSNGLANMNSFFEKTGPKWHASQGRQLDIPVLFGQGLTDNLFNLNQALKNYEFALTQASQAGSIVVGYNGGHALPSTLPPGSNMTAAVGGVSADPCSAVIGGGSFGALAVKFMQEKLKGESKGLAPFYGTVNLATAGGRCQHGLGTGDFTEVQPLGATVSPTGAGVPQNLKLADGPLKVAGPVTAVSTVTPLGVDARVFFALSVGKTPADARIVQNNMLPLHLHDNLPGDVLSVEIELPSVAVDVPAGESLFLAVSPFSDMSFGHGSRVPGGVLFQSLGVLFPRV